MNDTFPSPSLRKALFLSAGVNSLMALAGLVASLFRPLRWVGWIARIIATPPGLLLRFAIHSGSSSVAYYALAALEGIVGSMLFYAFAFWGALTLRERLRGEKPPPDPA